MQGVQMHLGQLNFITAGNAVFTLQSLKTNNHFTFKVKAKYGVTPEDANMLFVYVLTGPDNTSSYTYIGLLRNVSGNWQFEHSVKSRIKADAPSVVAFNYCFNGFYRTNRQLTNVKFFHAGCCCRCGRKLTTPESVTNGIGPECASYKTKRNVQGKLFH